ncbi:tyrosine-type recombinase/integrase [Streptomyces exfoliatus]|uniref:Tyrosine-type recombinase/integrase n=1 Tax=Streptomyces exfoliatus TaxID=1905 RepID=A0ABV3D1P8_STREX
MGLPPVRLHDLRHGAATLAPAAGAGLKAVQEMLGRSSISVTADTYTSLLSEADLAIAEATPLSSRAPGTPACRPAGSCRFLGGHSGACHAVRSRPAHANGPGRGVRGRVGHRPGQKPQISDA